MNYQNLIIIFNIVITFFLTSQASLGEDAPPTLLNKASVSKTFSSVTKASFPNADSVLIDDFEKIRYFKDGTSVKWDEVYTKILTEKGKREYQTLSLYFTLPYSKVKFSMAEIIKPDGTTIPVDIKANSKEMVDPSQMGSNIYNPNSKILKLSIPGIELGDVLHYLTYKREIKTRMPNTWSDYFVLEYTSPIKHYTIEITGPNSLPIKNIVVKDEVKGTIRFSKTKMKDTTTYRWVIENVPRMFKEPNMPPLYTVVQRLLVSTIPDWPTISEWYWNLCVKPLQSTTPAMKNLVKKLIKGKSSETEKINAIFQYVSQKIRYMGITTEKVAPGYEPHNVNITFENKYGVCRDKAALLVAMLRLAGLKAYPVLIHNGPKKDKEVPQPYFNHAIVSVQKQDGTYILMDPTDENTKEIFPSYLCDQSYLVAKPEGETLLTSAIIPADKNLMHISTTGRITEEGTLSAETILSFQGINDNAYRGYFARIKPEQRKLFLQKKLKALISGATIEKVSIKPDILTDVSTPLEIKIDYSAPNYMIKGKTESLLKMPWFGTSFGIVNFILGKTGLKERKYPLKTDIACGVQEEIDLKLNNSLRTPTFIPNYKKLSDRTISWQRSLKVRRQHLTGKSTFLIKKPELSPADYSKLKNYLKEIELNERKVAIFSNISKQQKPVKAVPDIKIISKDIKVQVTTKNSWKLLETVEKQILTYAGKKRHSEIKISYNPIWEKVKIVAATVTSADGKIHKLKEDELNTMDASWVGSAPRYPPGKVLVASLPNVDLNATIKYTIEYVFQNHPFFSFTEYFRDLYPIEKMKVTLGAPEAIDIKLSTFHTKNVKSNSSTQNGINFYEWSIENQPKEVYENYTPPAWSYQPTLLCSTGSWPLFCKKVQKQLLAAASNQSACRKLSEQLVANKQTLQEKVTGIRNFIEKNIRTAGPAFSNLPLSAISNADLTLKEGYGNTTDKAVLYYSMLKATGLSPQFVLVADFKAINSLFIPIKFIPQLFPFQDVLVRVRSNNSWIYLNDTNQYAMLGTTYSTNTIGLVLETKGFTSIKIPKALNSGIHVDYTISLDNTGHAIIKKTTSFYGTNYNSYVKHISELTPEKRRRYFQEAVSSLSQRATPVTPLQTDISNYPAKESFKVKIKNYAVKEGSYLYMDLPIKLKKFIRIDSDKRIYPYYQRNPVNITYNVKVNLPSNTTNLEIYPPDINWEGPSKSRVFAKSEYNSEGSKEFKLIQQVAINPFVLPPVKYKSLLELDRTLSHPIMKTLLIKLK